MEIIFEPSELNLENIHPESQVILRRTGWLNFFEKFNGHNVEVSKAFALSFDGEQAQIGNLTLHIS